MWKTFVPLGVPYASFFSKVQEYGQVHKATPVERVLMFRLGAIEQQTTKAAFISLGAFIKALNFYSCPQAAQKNLQDLRNLETCNLVGDEALLLNANQAANLNPIEAAPTQPLPMSLPPPAICPRASSALVMVS